ncbi:MAG: AAA family ATPase [Pseudomonadota bacterium]
MPKVVFKSDYKSIVQFEELQLPSFSILTGVNGCGKTHFLQSIQHGAVVVDDITLEEIQYFDPRTFVVGNEGQHSKSQIDQERAQAWKNFNEGWNNLKLKQELVKHKNQLRELKDELVRISEELDKPILRLSKEDIVLENSETELKTYNAFRQYRREVLKLFKHKQITNDAIAKSVRALASRLKYPLDEISEREFKESYVPLDLKDDFLPTQLSKVFLDYHYREYMELVIRRAEANYYNEEARIKTSEAFAQIYGPPPWEVVEDILTSFSSLNFSINNPKADGLTFRNDEETSFALRIRNPEGQEISFGDLSSGEKVLFALVLSIYKTFSDSYFPRLLLLDEIDASLHPSMVRNLLDVLDNVFVKEHGVHVILATHSPSTVALAPPESIHVMSKDVAEKKIRQSSPSEALSVLTEGFATLNDLEPEASIEYVLKGSSDPVVFVEGITDKIILETAWRKLNPDTNMPFIVQDCFDASFLCNLFKRGADSQDGIFTNYGHRKLVAMFDFDSAGFAAWNGIKKQFTQIEHDPRKGLTKKHETVEAFTTLLPVPDFLDIQNQVISEGNSTFGDKSSLQIEHYFFDVDSLKDYFVNEAIPGGGQVVRFIGSKRKFAFALNALGPEDFSGVALVFSMLDRVLRPI